MTDQIFTNVRQGKKFYILWQMSYDTIFKSISITETVMHQLVIYATLHFHLFNIF